MKITKQRLTEIIKEEIEEISSDGATSSALVIPKWVVIGTGGPSAVAQYWIQQRTTMLGKLNFAHAKRLYTKFSKGFGTGYFGQPGHLKKARARYSEGGSNSDGSWSDDDFKELVKMVEDSPGEEKV